jgi:copper(I)-binding protein
MILLLSILIFIYIPHKETNPEWINLKETGAAKIKIENAWLRPAAKGMNSALYFDIKNESGKPDNLYKVTSNIAKIVQVHETIKNKDNTMGMAEVKNLVIPTNIVLKFEPGGYHVMLIDIKKDLKINSEVGFTFYFKLGGKVKIKAIVKQE